MEESKPHLRAGARASLAVLGVIARLPVAVPLRHVRA